MVSRSASDYLASRMRFILFVLELKGALYCDRANTLFVVESISRHGTAASTQFMVISAPWMSIPRDQIKSLTRIIS